MILCYLEEMTYEAAAQRLGLTGGRPFAAGSQKARDLLHLDLGEEVKERPRGDRVTRTNFDPGGAPSHRPCSPKQSALQSRSQRAHLDRSAFR